MRLLGDLDPVHFDKFWLAEGAGVFHNSPLHGRGTPPEMTCDLGPGDMLINPGFWAHSVVTTPDPPGTLSAGITAFTKRFSVPFTGTRVRK